MQSPNNSTRTWICVGAAVIIGLAVACAGIWLWGHTTERPVTAMTPLDPSRDMGIQEHSVPSSQKYVFVYVVENSPKALKAMPAYGDTPRKFTFNAETQALYLTTRADVPIDTRLVVGYEAMVADFLLDTQFLSTRAASLTMAVKPLKMRGHILTQGSKAGDPVELVQNDIRPIGSAKIEDLGNGRVRVTRGSQTRELDPGTAWRVSGPSGSGETAALIFINHGLWPLKAVTMQE